MSCDKNLNKILDQVHDRSVDINLVQFNEIQQTLIIPLTVDSEDLINHKIKYLIFKYGLLRVFEAELRIEGVSSYYFEDPGDNIAFMINNIIINNNNFIVDGSTPNCIKGQGSEISLVLNVFEDQYSEVWKFWGFGFVHNK
jgi:hypothetical protein